MLLHSPAQLTKDGVVRHTVPYFNKFGKRVGEYHSKRTLQTSNDISFSAYHAIGEMKYQISVGVTLSEEGEKNLSFYFKGIPVDSKLHEWFCFVDAELRLVHPRSTSETIAYSGTTVMSNSPSVDKQSPFGWDDFASWQDLQPFLDSGDRNKLTVEVVIRNQILFSVCDSTNSHREPIPTRRQLDDFVRPLFRSEELADVHLRVDSDAEIPAHRLVLAAKSVELRRLLYVTKPYDRVIDLKREGFPGITQPALLSILKFFYRSQLILNDDILADVYYAGKKFKVDVILETCKLFVRRSNVVKTLAKSVELGLKHLLDKCWQEIQADAVDFIKSPEFLAASPDELKKLLVSDRLSAPEYAIFKATRAWAAKRCADAGNLSPSGADMRAFLGERICLLRLPLIKVEKLERILQENDGLFNQSEIVQISLIIKGRPVADPLFSSKRRDRAP